MSCEECPRREQRFRVLKADLEFELRKTIEDKAEQKALYEITVQKQLRKCQDKYQKQKLDHQENTKTWITKIDQLTADCQSTIAQHQKNSQLDLEQAKTEITAKFQEQAKDAAARHQREVREIRETNEKEKMEAAASSKSQLAAVEERYTSEISRTRAETEQREERVKRQFDSICTGLRSQKNAEEKMGHQLREENRRDRCKSLSEMYDFKGVLTKHETTIRELKAEVREKQGQLEKKDLAMAKAQNQNSEEIGRMRQEQEKQMSEWAEEREDQVERFYVKELEITQKYEQSIKSIEEKREYEQQLYQNNVEEIRGCIESRQSKVEDLEEILMLREKLSRKGRDYDNLVKEARYFQLELENKEDTYNKLFIPSVNSGHLSVDGNTVKRKELKLKRTGKHASSAVRDILHAVNVNSSNLPFLHNVEKKYLPPASNKIL